MLWLTTNRVNRLASGTEPADHVQTEAVADRPVHHLLESSATPARSELNANGDPDQPPTFRFRRSSLAECRSGREQKPQRPTGIEDPHFLDALLESCSPACCRTLRLDGHLQNGATTTSPQFTSRHPARQRSIVLERQLYACLRDEPPSCQGIFALRADGRANHAYFRRRVIESSTIRAR